MTDEERPPRVCRSALFLSNLFCWPRRFAGNAAGWAAGNRCIASLLVAARAGLAASEQLPQQSGGGFPQVVQPLYFNSVRNVKACRAVGDSAAVHFVILSGEPIGERRRMLAAGHLVWKWSVPQTSLKGL